MITNRALNRALLARQCLLERVAAPVDEVVERVVGLQAQVPRDPYVGLWSRVDGFEPDQLERSLLEKRVVRIVVMRGTVHLVTVADAARIRPLMQPVLDHELARHSEHKDALRTLDMGPVLALARELMADRPLAQAELRAAIEEQLPGTPAAAAAYAVRNLVPLVQVPPRGLWAKSGQPRTVPLDLWVDSELPAPITIDELVLRYLRAFGPATPGDVTAWCRLTGMREVIDRLRPRLRTFRDERNRELFDVEDGVLPDEHTPAPVRFLPEYDNALLSHADRARYTPDDIGSLLTAGPVHGTVLVDGTVAATWSKERLGDAATLTVRHLRRPQRDVAAVAAEGERMLRFVEPTAASHDVRLVAVG